MTQSTDFAAPLRPTTLPGQDGPGDNPRRNLDHGTYLSAGSVVGYARVSTSDQVLDRQIHALNDAGCERIFTDQGVSGTRTTRPGLDACLAYVRPGDVLVVQSLDRLGRRTTELLRLVDELASGGVALRILTLGVDTTTPAGQMVLAVMAALSQMERDVLVERTREGLAAARARGRVGGRPRVLSDEQVEVALEWRRDGRAWTDIARLLGASERTIRRRVSALQRRLHEPGTRPDAG